MTEHGRIFMGLLLALVVACTASTARPDLLYQASFGSTLADEWSNPVGVWDAISLEQGFGVRSSAVAGGSRLDLNLNWDRSQPVVWRFQLKFLQLDYLVIRLNGMEYQLGIGHGRHHARPGVFLAASRDWAQEVANNPEFIPKEGVWYQLAVELGPDKIRVWFDDELVLEGEDSRFQSFQQLQFFAWESDVILQSVELSQGLLPSVPVETTHATPVPAQPDQDVAVLQPASSSQMRFTNPFDTPLYAAAARLPANLLYDQLGLESGTPLEIVTEQGSVPLSFASDRSSLYAYVSVPARGSITGEVRKIDSWPTTFTAVWDETAGKGKISNGFIAAEYDQAGIGFFYVDPFEGSNTPIVQNFGLNAWLDDRQSGMLSAQEAERLGLTRLDLRRGTVVAAAVEETADAVQLRLEKTYDEGFGKGLLFSEILTMYAGQPLLEYRVRIENTNDFTVYLANMTDRESSLTGVYGSILRSGRLVVRRPSVNTEVLPPMAVLSTDGERMTNLKPSQGWGERIAYVESPTGYGLGTAMVKRQVFSHQWHRWTISLTNFAMPLSTEGSALPAPIRPGQFVELGAALIASSPGTDGYKETLQAYNAYMGNRMPDASVLVTSYIEHVPLGAGLVSQFRETFSSLDLWMVTEGTLVQLEDGARLSGVDSAEIIFAAKIDLERQPLVGLTVDALSAGTSLRFHVENAAGDPLAQLHTDVPGHLSVDPAKTAGLGGQQLLIFRIQALGTGEVGAVLGEFTLEPDPPPPVILKYPQDGAVITDVATSFSWERIEGIEEYRIQVATDKEFSQLVMDGPTRLPISHRMDPGSHHPVELLPAGVYYWRMQGIAPDGISGHWSAPNRLLVTSDHFTVKPLRPISSELPLFTADAFRAADLGIFVHAIPQHLRPFFAFYTSGVRDEGSDAILSPLDEHSVYKFISMWTPLAEIERAFQTSPYVLGVWEGEQLGDVERVERIILLCAKYGRYFHFTDGSHVRFSNQEMYNHPRLAALLREYSEYILFGHKTNIASISFTAMGAHFGAWLDGMMDNLAMLFEAWYWDHAGFRSRLDQYYGLRGGDMSQMPANFWLQQAVLALSQGTSALTFGGQGSTTGSDPMTFWTRDGRVNPAWPQRIVPFMEAVLRQQMVPSREEVMANIQAAVLQDVPVTGRHENRLGPYDALFRNTYGLRDEGEIYELIPNTGQYYWIPLLPADSTGLAGVANIPLSQLQDPQVVQERFQGLYPQKYGGSAWVNLVGPRFFVMTTHENRSDRETYVIDFGDSLVSRMKGEVGPHQYIMGRAEAEYLWLQTGAQYREPDVVVQFTLREMPDVQAFPKEALLGADWDEKTQELSVTISNQFGPVELELYVREAPVKAFPQFEQPSLQGFSMLRPVHGQLNVDPENLLLSWQGSSGAEAFQVVVGLDSELEQRVAEVRVPGTMPFVEIKNLQYGKEYFWQVWAIRGAEVVASQAVQFFATRPATDLPTAPRIKAVRDVFGVVVLDWTPGQQVDRYIVYRRPDGESTWTAVGELARSATRFIDHTVKPDHQYNYSLTAVNHLGTRATEQDATVHVRLVTELLDEDFAQGQPQHWRVQGRWTVEQGLLQFVGAFPVGHGSVLLPVALRDNTLIQMQFRINELISGMFPVLRLSFHVHDRDRYQLFFWPQEGRFELSKRTSAGSTLLAEGEMRLPFGVFHALEIQVIDGHIQVYGNGHHLLEYSDQQPIGAGEVEIYVNNLRFDVEQVQIFAQEADGGWKR